MDGKSIAAVAAVLALTSFFAPAAQAAEDRPLQVEREIVTYVVNADGSFVQTQEQAIKVLKDTGLQAAKESSVTYSTSIQHAEVIAAYTLKPDGRRIEVPRSNYQLSSQSGHDGDSPVYSDLSSLSVVFPDLAVGDTTVFSYRLTAREAMFPGQFSIIENYNPARYYGQVRITIDAPESMAARWQGWQLTEAPARVANGRRIVEWNWQNRTPVDPESLRDSVFNYERYPGYAFSTFKDYAQIARAYGVQAERKAAPTERIRTLANEIAGPGTEPREDARKLYEWVSTNISYAGNCIGLGAVVPRDLDAVLDNRMGDCKDHATLLQALLKARGIESTQALVNAGSAFSLPAVPVASVVNHVINYIPGLDLYLDSTASDVPFATLPPSVAGKPVLLVQGHHDDARTPATQAGSEWQKMKTDVRILGDGSVQGSLRLELSGARAAAARAQFRSMDRDTADKLVRNYFRTQALIATGSVRYPDPEPMLDTFNLEADFTVDRMLPPAGGFSPNPWFISLAPIAALVSGQVDYPEQPAGEGACAAVFSEEEYTYEFAPSYRIVAVPTGMQLDEGTISYRSSYRQTGNRISVNRRLDDRTPGPLCSAEYNSTFGKTMRRLLPDVRAQIVYLQSDGAR